MKYLKKYSTEAERQAATAIEPSASIVVEDEGVYYDRAWDTPTEVLHENKSPYWTWDWKFIRPTEWPNLDEFDIAHATNTIVMTYDCRDRIAHPSTNNDHFHVKCSSSGSVIERYKVVNGEFVLTWTTTTTASNEVVSHLLPTNEGDYVVYKLYQSNTWHRYFFNGNDVGRGEDGYRADLGNKILEIQGNDAGFASCGYCWGSPFLRRFLWYSYSSQPMYFYTYIFAFSSIEHFEFKTPWYVNGDQGYVFLNSPLKYFDFDNVTYSTSPAFIQYFLNCSQLEEVHFGENVPAVKSINSMFEGCSRLQFADVENIQMTNVANYSSVFRYCRSLENIDISTWDFSIVTSCIYMFDGCHKLKNIIFGNYDFGEITTCAYMFQNCQSISYISLSGRTIDLSKCASITYLFYSCRNLQEIDMSGWNLSGMTNQQNAQNVFANCGNLKKIVLPSNLTVIHGNSFAGCFNLKTLILNVATPPTATQIQNYFSSWNPNYKIYVPDASVATYKTATGWLNAADHIYGISTYTGD